MQKEDDHMTKMLNINRTKFVEGQGYHCLTHLWTRIPGSGSKVGVNAQIATHANQALARASAAEKNLLFMRSAAPSVNNKKPKQYILARPAEASLKELVNICKCSK